MKNNKVDLIADHQSIIPKEVKSELEKLRKMEYAVDQTSFVMITDYEGKIIYVNDLLCEVTGFRNEELIGQFYGNLYSNEFKEMHLLDNVKMLKEGQHWRGEILSKKKDGSTYWVQSTIVPILNEKCEQDQYYFLSTEMTKEKELEAEAKRSNENYRLIAENTCNLVALIESDGTFKYTSPTFQNILNYDLSSLKRKNLFELIHPDDINFVKQDVQAYCRKRNEPIDVEFRIRNEFGEYVDVEANIRVISDTSYSQNELMIVVMKDIRKRKEIEKTIYHLAYHDVLTNLPNRRTFMNQLRDELLLGQKTKTKLSVLFVDLDNFKSVNDQWGHDKGDLVLKEAAKLIQASIRKTDVAARLGGDEFMVMLRDVRDEEETISVVKKILEKFQSPFIIEDQEFLITCSIGVANYPEHGNSSEELIKNADDALYNVKGRGKNSFVVFNKSIENHSLERRLLETALRNGIKEQQFYLEYQPKLNISTNELVGMEALVRWKHPELGVIPPLKFISLAESTGLIVPLGEWILRESFRQTKEWQDKGYTPLIVSVNISVRQLEDPQFIEKVQNLLKETGLDSKWIEFEVTESIFADLKNTVSILQEVRDLGIQISVDDFGTGYSSLSYIKHLPVDTLKIDQSFVKDIHVNQESKAIVLAVLNLAKTIGLNVIAEGIELKEHVEELSKDGLLFGQGYFYSRPLKSQAFEDFINQNVIV